MTMKQDDMDHLSAQNKRGDTAGHYRRGGGMEMHCTKRKIGNQRKHAVPRHKSPGFTGPFSYCGAGTTGEDNTAGWQNRLPFR